MDRASKPCGYPARSAPGIPSSFRRGLLVVLGGGIWMFGAAASRASPPSVDGGARRQMGGLSDNAGGTVDGSGIYHPAAPAKDPENRNAAAGEDSRSNPAPKARVLENGCVELGEILVDPKLREMSFPVEINTLRAGTPLEYALVTRQGKAHESLMVTDVPPSHIHVAALLLGLSPERRAGKSIEIRMTYETNGGPVTELLSKNVVFERDGQQEEEAGGLPDAWKYQGAEFRPGFLVASREGSIIALKNDPGALIGSAFQKKIDGKGTPVAGWNIGHFLGASGSVTLQVKEDEARKPHSKSGTAAPARNGPASRAGHGLQPARPSNGRGGGERADHPETE